MNIYVLESFAGQAITGVYSSLDIAQAELKRGIAELLDEQIGDEYQWVAVSDCMWRYPDIGVKLACISITKYQLDAPLLKQAGFY